MKLETFALLLLVLLAAFYGGWYLYDTVGEDFFAAKPVAEQAPATAPAGVETEPPRLPMPARHPVSLPEKLPEAESAQATEPAFPISLDEGDAYLKQRLPPLIKNRKLFSLLDVKYFIQKLVFIIDQLPEASISRQHLPIVPPEPGFITGDSGDQLVIGAENAKRYKPYIELLEAIPDPALLRLYQGLYPLFQQAYRESSGKPNGHFNDRLIQVIDHLLKTPEPAGPLALTPHISRFKYADETLESLSAGQKTLLRMGVDNTRRVKNKLQRFRQGLVGEG
jgi:hypothetical protein